MAALAVVASVRRYAGNLASPWFFEDDTRHHVWWTYRFADPTLFKGDLAADYFSKLTFSPLGYQTLARAFVPWVDAQTFSEIVPFFLTAIVAILAVLVGRSVSGGSWLGAATAGVFALQGGVLARVEGGLPRAWAMPVLMFGLWTVLEKKWALFGVALLLAALMYPPLLVNIGLLGGVLGALDFAGTRRLPRGFVAAAALGAAAVVIVTLAYREPQSDPTGPKVTRAVARAMPEFGPEGRSHFFSDDPVAFYVTNQRSGFGLAPWKLVAAAVALGLFAWLLPGAVPRAVWVLLATALVAYVLAHAVLFKLHLPSRYTRFAFPAVIMSWLAAIVPAAVARLRQNAGFARLFAAATPRVLTALAAGGVLVVGVLAALHVRRDLARSPEPGYPELIRFVSGLSTDTLIAAHPTDANSIPLLARRSVVANEETSTPYDLGYYAAIKERLMAELLACYAADWAGVDRLARFGVSAFVVDRRRYAKPVDRARVYFEPFRSAIADAIALGEAAGFVLEKPPPERVLFESGPFLVVRVKGPA